jgi:hypothetical protein
LATIEKEHPMRKSKDKNTGKASIIDVLYSSRETTAWGSAPGSIVSTKPPKVLTTWVGVRIPPTSIWGGDLIEGNSRDLSYLRARELWVRIMGCLIITQMYPTPCQIRVQVGRDNERTCESLFIYLFIFYLKKKKKKKKKKGETTT